MEVLFHLIFKLIKIAVLSSVYAGLIILGIRLLAEIYPSDVFKRIRQKQSKTFLMTASVISLALLLFMFTHFGNSGLGDTARIPIGHFRAILQADGRDCYIQDVENGIFALDIHSFYISKDFVYGLTSPQYNPKLNKEKYFLYDLKTNKLNTFTSLEAYHKVLKKHQLNSNAKLHNFSFYYKRYWSGWRLYLLP